MLLVLALVWGADTSTGHRLIADRIERLRPANGLRVSIGRIEGSIYGRARLIDVRLSDPQGVFFEAAEARLDWKPWRYLGNALDIEELVVPQARLERLPRLLPTGRRGPILPGFDIRIGRLEVMRLTVGRAVAGQERSGRLSGRADIRDGHALIELDARASGGDLLALKLDAEPDRDRFDLAARLNAPSGGVFGAMIGTKLPVALQVAGDGNWRVWRGRFAATAAGRPVAQLALGVDAGRYRLEGVLRPSLVTTGRVQRLTGPELRVRGEATLANRRLDTRLGLQSAALALSADGVLDLANSAFDGMLVEARALQPGALLANMRARDLKLAVRLDGAFSTARFDYLLTSPVVFLDRTGFEAVRASGQGRLSRSPVNVPLRLTARRVTGVGDVAGGLLANLRVEGLLRVTSRLITGDGLRVSSDRFNSRVSVLVDLATGRYDIGLSGALNRYLIPGLGIVDVKSELRVVPGADGRGTRIIGSGQAWVRRFDNAFLRNLAGGLPYIETGLERTPDGLIRFTNLRLRAPALTLAGSGYRRLDGSFHFEGAGVQRQYGPVRLVLDGPIERPRVDLRLARPLPAAGLSDVRLSLRPTPQGFDWQAAGGSRLGPFAGQGAILLPRGGTTSIRIDRLAASGLVATGTLRLVTGGFDGRVALSGSGVTGFLALRPQNGVQRIDANLAFRDARLAGPPVIAVRRGQLTAAILLDPRGVSVQASGQGAGLRYGTVNLARLSASARITGGSGTVNADFAGARGRPFDLKTVTQFSPGRIVVRANGSVDRQPLSLSQPAVLVRDGDGWRLQPTALTFAGGNLRVGGRFSSAETALDATVERLPLRVLDIGFPQLGLGGVASGQVQFRLPTGGTPSGRANLRVRGLSRAGLVLSPRPIDAGINAVLNGSGLALRAVAASGGQIVGRAQLRASPLPAGGAITTRISRAPLFAQLRYAGPADTIWRLTGVEGLDVSGPVAVGADVGGTLADPQIRGSLRTENLRVESAASGTVLTGLKGEGRFGGSRLVIDRFTANAGRGTIAGRAAFDLSSARGFGIDIAGTADNAEVIRRDDIGATITGPVAIRSQGANGVISGDVVLNRSAYRLGRATAAATVPTLRVREINRRPDVAEDDAPPTTWRLAIKARAPNRLAVTGLGLDSEWRADLDIGGTLNAPAITGRAEVVRGGYEFAGKRFELDRGVIRFQGAVPADPILDIVASGNIQSINAQIRVGGTGQRPEITFSSTPALPQDELLSRLLFGTSITNLSAAEAFQLASAVNGLRGGSGLDPINAIRRAVGLDRLRIVPADASTGQRTALALGKYITRRAYVEIVSDGAGYTATRLEFEVTRWLSLLSTISSIGRQSVSARVSRDY